MRGEGLWWGGARLMQKQHRALPIPATSSHPNPQFSLLPPILTLKVHFFKSASLSRRGKTIFPKIDFFSGNVEYVPFLIPI